MKKVRFALLGGLAAVLASASVVWAVGLWPGLPIEGGASYCAGYSGYNTGNTTPGTFTTTQCANTVPAGQATPTGQEAVPTDLWGLNQTTNSQGQPATNLVAAMALGGFGPFVVNSTAASATIPNNTPNYIYTATASASSFTFTLPAAPVPWQVQHIAFTTGTASGGAIVVAANSNQSCVPSSSCGTSLGSAAAATYVTYIYDPANTTWYKIQ